MSSRYCAPFSNFLSMKMRKTKAKNYKKRLFCVQREMLMAHVDDNLHIFYRFQDVHSWLLDFISLNNLKLCRVISFQVLMEKLSLYVNKKVPLQAISLKFIFKSLKNTFLSNEKWEGITRRKCN